MTVVTPAEVARRAATILVDIPPVPSAEPAEDTVKEVKGLRYALLRRWKREKGV